ncbi:MAG: ComEC/Rec2 family competence protein [Phycisphaerales bacterium]|nr:ComEC/Rec2 family competence protein [Hyphomonadaceae bacterium]
MIIFKPRYAGIMLAQVLTHISSVLSKSRNKSLSVAAMRSDLSAAVREAAPGRGGGIAAALISGDRSAVDRDTNEMLFNAGLGHLLSVSGIHMSIVGGLVFALLLWGLSLIAPLALRWPVKKLAAIGALAAVAAYLIVSGINVPALRSFVMAAVAFGAILLDRPAISMRGLGLAALIVVALFPESVLEPGFQMSFAATMALVALFEMLKRAPHEPALPAPGPLIGAMQSITRGVGAVILISLVAGLATDPFAVYHFQRFSIYSLPANLLAEPILSFLVAPAAIAAAVLAPFGLAEPALQIMASALDLIAAIGQTFGERPEGVRALPRPPDGAFVLCVIALIWACLWRGALRWGGAAFFAAGIALYLGAPQPIAAFDADMRVVYARVDQGDGVGWASMSRGGGSSYARERLGAMLGLAPSATERLAPPETCGEAACVWAVNGRTLALVKDETGFAATCQAGALVIARVAAPEGYAQACALTALLDAPDIAQRGGALIYDTPAGLELVSAKRPEINRAWTPRGASLDQE